MKVISVENVSKRFVLAQSRQGNLADAARNVFSRVPRTDFWALKDVSFEVQRGEAIGIIGHNGAGKSTMLKLLTQIMRPTAGRIRTRGRVSALIEVGAGFHPEMTGRENIYLNGSILGMGRREINSKFDEIVAFAELEKFIDTPVKRYSSGMYARLGFAVAAHVDPEILIVDEVLSVGDGAFQERCTKKMHELRAGASTVVFVSHNMGAVTSLCDRAVLLMHGSVEMIGLPVDVIAQYRKRRSSLAPTASVTDGSAGHLSADLSGPLLINRIEPLRPTDLSCVVSGEALTLRLHYTTNGLVTRPRVGLRFRSSLGTLIARVNVGDVGQSMDISGGGYLDVSIPYLPLLPDTYHIEPYAFDAFGVSEYETGHCIQLMSVAQPEGVDTELRPGGHFGYLWMDAEWQWSGGHNTGIQI